MYHIITIGSATQDVYVFSKKFRVLKDSRAVTGEVECFTFGTKIELDDILFEIGGGATNTAYTFSRQGLKVACLTRIGEDGAEEEVQKFLKGARIADLSITDKKRRTAHSVVFLAKTGERTILVYRGAAHNFQTAEVAVSKIRNTRWVYITSLAGNLNLLKKIVNFCYQKNIKIALNPGKLEIRSNRQNLIKIFKKIDLLFLNHEEAAEINRRTYSNDKLLLTDLQKLCPGIIVITQGAKGCLCGLRKEQYRVIIKPIKAVDTTGAGDAFGSGFLAGFIRNKGNIKKALTLASNNAASVIKKIGAKHGLLSKRDSGHKISLKISKI